MRQIFANNLFSAFLFLNNNIIPLIILGFTIEKFVTNSSIGNINRFLEPSPPDLVFDGTGWLKYSANRSDLLRMSRLFLRFKSVSQNCILLSADTLDSNRTLLSIYILNGSLFVSAWIQTDEEFPTFHEQYEHEQGIDKVADGQWHNLILISSAAVVQIQLDHHRMLKALPFMLSSFYIGGYTEALLNKQSFLQNNFSNFVGCIQHVYHQSGNSGITDIVQMLSRSNFQNVESTRVKLKPCNTENIQPQKIKRDATVTTTVRFITTGGYLLLQGWNVISVGKMEFSISTYRKNCLLLFSSSGLPFHSKWEESAERKLRARSMGQLLSVVEPVEQNIGNDIFSVELREGYLIILINTGSGIMYFRMDEGEIGNNSKWYLSDGNQHEIGIDLKDVAVTIKIDGRERILKPDVKPR